MASQYPNKRALILHYHGYIIYESDNNDKEMSTVEDARYDAIKYLVKVESIMIRLALDVQVKEDDLEQQKKNIFHMRCLSTIRYVV
jgi:hypothetical protein